MQVITILSPKGDRQQFLAAAGIQQPDENYTVSGATEYEAVGKLILGNPDHFGIKVSDGMGTTTLGALALLNPDAFGIQIIRK